MKDSSSWARDRFFVFSVGSGRRGTNFDSRQTLLQCHVVVEIGTVYTLDGSVRRSGRQI